LFKGNDYFSKDKNISEEIIKQVHNGSAEVFNMNKYSFASNQKEIRTESK